MRHAIRQLLRRPGFTVIAVIVLALGIGANAAIFTLLDAFLLKPLPCREPERLVGVYSHDKTRPDDYRAFSYPNYLDIRSQNEVFEDAFLMSPDMLGLTEGDVTRRVMALRVTANYFSVFGVSPALGRFFLPEEETTPTPSVVVSHHWWVRHGADPGVIGRRITVSGKPATVVGVAPKGFAGTLAIASPELFVPMAFDPAGDAAASHPLTARTDHTHLLIARLKPGVTLAEAEARLAVVGDRLARTYPDANKDQALTVARLARMSMTTNPSDDRGVLAGLGALLLGMSCTVLLIACLNLANMLLARGAARRKEIAIRLAVGAARTQILRQLLLEGFLLALLGGAAGLGVAAWGTGRLASSLNSLTSLPLTFGLAVDGRVAAATFGFSLLATVFFALGPAWKLSKTDVNIDLKEQAGEDAGARRSGPFASRNLLVVGQVSLSLALLVAAGLFARGAGKALKINPGFRLDQGFYLEIDGSLASLRNDQLLPLYTSLQERVAALPGVEAASLAATIPFGVVSLGSGVQRAGAPIPPPLHAASPAEGQSIGANYSPVGSAYFKTMGVALRRGREFSRTEAESTNAPRVAIINTALAEKLWPGEEAVGKRIQLPDGGAPGGGAGIVLAAPGSGGRTMEVVGVVPPFRNNLGEHDAAPMVFVPLGQDPRPDLLLHVKALPAANADALARTVRDEVRRLSPNLPVLSVKSLRNHFETSIQLWLMRVGASLFLALGGVAALLAVLGVYAVKAYSVSRRTREIGIRMALGAARADVVGLILRDGAKLAGAGLALGLLFAAGAAQAMSGVLFEVRPFDPVVFTLAPLLLSASALLACWLPARRAAGIDPLLALRKE